ncbi:hypothetical protein BSY17_1920 [Sphingobium sp. RAC03]|nr:hypothetical protein BSY17_1920 [Sphingobium sp. RAC03]
MSQLDLNGERRRKKLSKRRRWAKPLIRPQTLKAVFAIGRWIAQILGLALAAIKFFRE